MRASMGRGRRGPSICSAYAGANSVPVLELAAKELEWSFLERADPDAGGAMAALPPLRPISSPGPSGISSHTATDDSERQMGQQGRLGLLSLSVPPPNRGVTAESPGSLPASDLTGALADLQAPNGNAMHPMSPGGLPPPPDERRPPSPRPHSLLPIRGQFQTRFSAAVLRSRSANGREGSHPMERSQSLIPRLSPIASSGDAVVPPQTVQPCSHGQQGVQRMGTFPGSDLIASGQKIVPRGNTVTRAQKAGSRVRLQPLVAPAALRSIRSSTDLVMMENSTEPILTGSSFGVRTETPKTVARLERQPTAPAMLRHSAGSLIEGRQQALRSASSLSPSTAGTRLDSEVPGRCRAKIGGGEQQKQTSSPVLARQQSEKRPWGAPKTASKRTTYQPPATALPSAPLLRPQTSWEMQPKFGSSSGMSAPSRLHSIRARRDNICNCKEHHLPHKHIISPVDRHVKLETLTGALSIVHSLHQGGEPSVSDTEFDECRPSLFGNQLQPDSHGAMLCCSSLLLRAREIYMACSSMKADGNDKIRQVEQFKLRRWADSAGLLTPQGALQPVDLDIVFRHWKIKESVLQKAGSKFVLFLDLLYQLCQRGMPGIGLPDAFKGAVGVHSDS